MKKSIALILLCLVMVLSFVSCGDEDIADGSDTVDASKSVSETTEAEETTEETEPEQVETDIWTKRY